jgi:hypothetical protein
MFALCGEIKHHPGMFLLTESRLSLGLVINIDYDVGTDVKFEQVDHEFDLELTVNRKSISISN